jgi:hypothetical protein
VNPVEGQGCSRWNSRVSSRDRYSLAESALEAIATATMHETKGAMGMLEVHKAFASQRRVAAGFDANCGSENVKLIRQRLAFSRSPRQCQVL